MIYLEMLDDINIQSEQSSRRGLLTVCLLFLSPAGIPAAPGRPVAQEASSTAVMVHWPPPASSAHSAVSSYTVEYRQEGMFVWEEHFTFEHAQKLNLFSSSLPLRLVAMAASSQQQRGVCSDRYTDSRRSLSVQSASLQPLGGRTAL